MEMQSVNSTNLARIGYDEATSDLRIEFKDNSLYEFFRVPVTIYLGLKTASSKGKYFNSYIKDKYGYKQLR